MVRSCKKHKSKRVTCRKRYKILRKVREHHRKVRKDKKKNPKLYKRKDPGIPNSLPFKEQLLKHIKETRRTEKERRLALMSQAKEIGSSSEKPQIKVNNVNFSKQFTSVLNNADVVIEVLDARDPLGTRSLEAENAVLAAGRRLILLLNKIDLIPLEVLQHWLGYFRKWYTTVPFKANSQETCSRLNNFRGKIPVKSNFSAKGGLGVDGLKVLLGNICRHNGGKLTVGLVGLPNTGKSAVINTLVCRKVAASGGAPGLTRECQVYKIDKRIELIDSPGILLSKSEDPCELVLRNCIKPESMEVLDPVVAAILSWCPKRQIMVQYSVSEYENTMDFLCKLAQKMGKLRKGGAPDVRGAARVLVNDWLSGKLAHHTIPPENDAPIAEPTKPVNIAFDDIDFPIKEIDQVIFNQLTKSKKSATFCPVAVVTSSAPFRADLEGNWTDAENTVDNDENMGSSGSGDGEERDEDGEELMETD